MGEYLKIADLGRVIEERLAKLAAATTGEHGIWRPVYSEADRTGRAMVKEWMEKAGLQVKEDAVGNLFGRIPGRLGDGGGTVLAASHIDTVKDGGKYDGAAGVVTALSVAEALLKEGWQPDRPVEVGAFVEEEGSRYSLSYLGSRAVMGEIGPQELACEDGEGISLADAMTRAGYHPERAGEARRTDVKEYIELHVEQGPWLERQGITIGAVENIVGLAFFEVTIKGEQNHAGTTPMKLRKDPAAAMAAIMDRLTTGIPEISQTAVITVGSIKLHPGISNVIPREASFSIDLRDGAKDLHDKEKAFVMETIEKVVQERGLEVEINRPCDEPPAALNQEMISDLVDAVEEAGLSCVRMNSGAGHDAQVFSATVPACMIFIPSQKGISHSPLEYTKPEDLGAGALALAGLLQRRAAKRI